MRTPILLLALVLGSCTSQTHDMSPDTTTTTVASAAAPDTAPQRPDPIRPLVDPPRPRPAVVPQVPIDGAATELLSITVDNEIAADEWTTAGQLDMDGVLVASLRYGFDLTHLVVRVDFNREVLGDDAVGVDIYLASPSSKVARATSLRGSVLGFGGTHMLRWRGTDPVAITLPTELPTPGRRFSASVASTKVGFDGARIEFAVPLDTLGEVRAGDTLLMKIAEIERGAEARVLPRRGPLALTVPAAWDLEGQLTAAGLEALES